MNLAAGPEYKKFRSLARQIAKYNHPPFVLVRGEHRDTQADTDATVQRYEGLGEMNAEQLAETTMMPRKAHAAGAPGRRGRERRDFFRH